MRGIDYFGTLIMWLAGFHFNFIYMKFISF